MRIDNLKPAIVALTAAVSAIIYTKKRIRKENRLKAIHSKADISNDLTKRN